MKPNMIKKWSVALLVAAGAAGLVGCEGLQVDEATSASNHSGIVADRVLTGQLSGVVVDEFGRGLEDVTVSAYGATTTTGANGTWTMSNVPITNLAITNVYDNGTDTEYPTDGANVEGKIYVTFEKAGYSTFNAIHEGAIAVISNSGDESGANSIVVDEISAAVDYVQLAQLNRTFIGDVYDLGESTYSFQKEVPSDVQLRLAPSYVEDRLYGFSDVATNDSFSTEFSAGYYGVNPIVISLDNGSFEITGAGALRDGYELRVDGTNYQPAGYPIWTAGVNQNLIQVYYDNNTVNSTAGDAGAYWKVEYENIATGTNSLSTDLGDLYVKNFDSDGVDLTVASISYQNGPLNLTSTTAGIHDNDTITIDSDVAELNSSSPIVVVFSEDVRSRTSAELQAAVTLYNDNLVLQDFTATLTDRTLTISPTASLSAGGYRLVLKQQMFIGKDGGDLAPADPNKSGVDVSSTDADFDSVFYIQYGTSDYTLNTLADLTQDADDDFAGSKGESEDVRMFVNTGSNTTEQTRIEELQDAIYDALNDSAPETDNLSYGDIADLSKATADVDNASISFTATKETSYEVTVTNSGVQQVYGATVNDNGTITLTGTGGDNGTGGSDDSYVDDTGTISFLAEEDGTAEILIGPARVGYTVAIKAVGELGTEESSTTTIELKDQFHPRAALQFASDNGQDNGSMAIFNLESTDETGEAAYAGASQLVYPKLNLTASLYDRSGYRGRSEDNDTNITGSTALSDDLVTQSQDTPLLAINEGDGAYATTTTVGKTYSGRSDQYYTKTDYDAWYYTGTDTTGSVEACTSYYVANITVNAITDVGDFNGEWYPSDVDGVVSSGAVAVSDDDDNQTTIPTTLSIYEDSGRDATYPDATSGETTGNILQTPTGCTPTGATGSTVNSGPNAQRTIVIEMTEDVADFTFDTAFKTTSGATLGGTATTNVIAGSNLDAELDDLTNATGELHLLATLGDWRKITDTPRWQSVLQNDVANTIGEDVSVNSMLQLIDLTDAAGNDIDVTHATGVVLADATPAMAYEATVNENSFSITFDQAVDEGLSDNFTVYGAYDNYTFVRTSTTPTWVVNRTNAYIDPFGNSIGAADNVTTSLATTTYDFDGGELTGETWTFTVADNETHDFSGYFAGISHNSATTTDDNVTSGTPSYFVEYDYVDDTNHNSWAAVDTFDRYDDSTIGPRLVGDDTHKPTLLTQATTAAMSGTDNASTYLFKVGSIAGGSNTAFVATVGYDFDINLAGAHVTTANDNDSEYTEGDGFLAVENDGNAPAAGDNDSSGAVQFRTAATGGAEITDDEIDFPLYFTWNNDRTNDRVRIPDNASNYNRVVLRFDKDVTDVTGARVFYYKPTSDNVTESGIFMPTDAALGSSGDMGDTVESDNGSVGFTTTIAGGDLVFRFPDMEASSFSTDNGTYGIPNHRIMIDNVTINGGTFTLMVYPPSSTDDLRAANDGSLTTFNTTDATDLPQIDFFRKVHLSGTNGPTLTVGDLVNSSVDNTTTLTFTEPLAGVSVAKSSTLATGAIGNANSGHGANYADNGSLEYTSGVDLLTTDLTIAEADSTPSVSADGSTTITIDLEAPIGETSSTNFRIGHGLSYQVTATDYDGEDSSTAVITLQRSHGENIDGRAAILNVISGDAIAE